MHGFLEYRCCKKYLMVQLFWWCHCSLMWDYKKFRLCTKFHSLKFTHNNDFKAWYVVYQVDSDNGTFTGTVAAVRRFRASTQAIEMEIITMFTSSIRLLVTKLIIQCVYVTTIQMSPTKHFIENVNKNNEHFLKYLQFILRKKRRGRFRRKPILTKDKDYFDSAKI